MHSAALIESLKRMLRACDFTYANVAEALALSEASVKRMFARHDLTLLRLEQVCRAAGIELDELLREALPVPAPAVVLPAPLPYAAAPQSAVPSATSPAVLTARLYPANDAAAQYGMVTGTVTNFMTGKGRFQMEYRGEVLVGEATRVDTDQRRGVASACAYSTQGTFMSCEYRMTTPYQGTGTCSLSSGARYALHLGG